MTADGKMTFTLFHSRFAREYHQDPPLGPVAQYSGRPRNGHLEFVFEVSPDAIASARAYRDATTDDLLLGLTYARDRLAAVPLPAKPVPHSVPPVPETTGDRWRLDVIVIDAGHGGRDVGAVANGLREKDVTLAVARRLGQYLEERLGVRVVYTRDDDRFIELKDRGHIANESGGKLFVSIHANAAGSRAAHGTETYFLGMHMSDAAQQVMERENSVVQFEENPEQYASFDEEALMIQTLIQSAYMSKSEELASLVEEQFSARVGRKSRGVKQAGFYVLWGASMPAILVELGFLTNTSEAEFLRSEAGQDYLASAIFRAVRAFKEQYERDLHLGD